MANSSRRAFLRALGVAGTVGVTGCSAFGSDGGAGGSIGGWSTVGRDPSRRGYAPEEAGPKQSPTVEWRSDRRNGGHRFHGPSVADGTVFASSDDGRLYALDVDGGKRWHVDLGGKPRDGAPPVADDTVLAAATDGTVYGLATADGTERWRYDAGERVYDNPVVRDGRAALVDETGTAHVLATEDGAVQWSSSVVPESVFAPAIGEDAVFVGGGNRLVAHSLADDSRLWRTEFSPGSDPELVDGTLLVADGDDALVGFDPSSGRERWRRPIDAPFLQYGPADRGTAVVVGGGNTKETFVAVDVADGTVEWSKAATARGEAAHVAGDVVYAVTASGYKGSDRERITLYAFDRESGDPLARQRLEDEITGFAGGDGSIFASDEGGFVRAIDAEDLSPRWRFGSNGDYHGHTTVVDGTVIAATDGRYQEQSAEIVALSAADGSEQWSIDVENQTSHGMTVADGTLVTGVYESKLLAIAFEDGPGQWRTQLSNPITGAPAVLDGTVYVAGEGGRVAAYALADGDPEWERILSGTPVGPLAAVRDPDGTGHVVVASDDGLWALDAETGEKRWRADGSFVTRPVVADERVYVATREDLLAVDRADGAERWRRSVDEGGIAAAPAVDDDRVYATGYVNNGPDGWIRAFSVADGSSQWRVAVGAPIIAAPTVADGVLYVGDRSGTLHARGTAEGTQRWRRSLPYSFLEQVTVVDGRVVLGGIGVRSLIEG